MYTHSANCTDDRRDSPGAARGGGGGASDSVHRPSGFQFLDKVVGESSQVLWGVQYIDKVVGSVS